MKKYYIIIAILIAFGIFHYSRKVNENRLTKTENSAPRSPAQAPNTTNNMSAPESQTSQVPPQPPTPNRIQTRMANLSEADKKIADECLENVKKQCPTQSLDTRRCWIDHLRRASPQCRRFQPYIHFQLRELFRSQRFQTQPDSPIPPRPPNLNR